ncbi:DUF4116 domain-containing protein, partial [Acinetobacter sp. BSP-28]|uniref:DUF4116 domain-containing protein n=1 Tax=Acinetobacter sp. BSP-28 TaxID=3344661 RepID=UPI0037702C10
MFLNRFNSLKKYGFALKYVHQQTEQICQAAVQSNPQAIKYVKEQTEGLCYMALRKDGMA